jgi:prepilin-type N-terminal cleavage/methylation domain-containing protein
MSRYGRYNEPGLTLVELLVALMVTSIIFAAVATLAYAMGNAQKSSEELSRCQTRVRYTTLRISEMIRYAKLVVQSGSDDLAIWRADDDADEIIDPSELVYIEAGGGRDEITLLDFPTASDMNVPLEDLKDGSAKAYLTGSYDERRTEVLPQCSSVSSYPDTIDENTVFVGIGFDLDEAGTTRHYEITAALRCRE